MRRALILLSLSTLAWPLAATAALPAASLAVKDSSARHSQSATLTLTLHYEMQCGYPGPGPLWLTLPSFGLAQASVLVDGKPTPHKRLGHSLKVTLPKRPQIMCDVMGPGTLTVKVSGITNPAQAGRYRLSVARASELFNAVLLIR